MDQFSIFAEPPHFRGIPRWPELSVGGRIDCGVAGLIDLPMGGNRRANQ